MEDLARVPPEGIDPELLLAADMAEYYGGSELTSAARVIVSQLKYSHRHPERSWTAARLRRADRAAEGRPRAVYMGVSETGERGDVLARLEFRLVSNMPCGVGLAAAVRAAKGWLRRAPRPRSPRGPPRRAGAERADRPRAPVGLEWPGKLRVHRFPARSGFELHGGRQPAPSRSSRSRTRSRSTCSTTSATPRSRSPTSCANERFPREPARRSSDPTYSRPLRSTPRGSLLPAPPRFTPPAHRVRTPDAARILAALDAAQDRRVLAHGPAGVGKTTAILALERELPPGSVVLTYDCFGDGDYETPGAGRHDGLRLGYSSATSWPSAAGCRC